MRTRLLWGSLKEKEYLEELSIDGKKTAYSYSMTGRGLD
jgi:hypothetical protein